MLGDGGRFEANELIEKEVRKKITTSPVCESSEMEREI